MPSGQGIQGGCGLSPLGISHIPGEGDRLRQIGGARPRLRVQRDGENRYGAQTPKSRSVISRTDSHDRTNQPKNPYRPPGPGRLPYPLGPVQSPHRSRHRGSWYPGSSAHPPPGRDSHAPDPPEIPEVRVSAGTRSARGRHRCAGAFLAVLGVLILGLAWADVNPATYTYQVTVTGLENYTGGPVTDILVPLPLREGEMIFSEEDLEGQRVGAWKTLFAETPKEGCLPSRPWCAISRISA